MRTPTKTQSVSGGLQAFPDLFLPIGDLRPLHISEHAAGILVSRVFPPDEQFQAIRTQVLTHRGGRVEAFGFKMKTRPTGSPHQDKLNVDPPLRFSEVVR